MATSDQPSRIKIVTVGDSNVGKTCLLFRHFLGLIPRKWSPVIFDSYAEELNVDGKRCLIEPWDTACREEGHERLRPLCYPGTSVFLLCFSVESKVSLTSCFQKWLPELQQHAPGVPCILVATKVDLRTSPKCLQCIPYDKGYQAAKQYHMGYMETSALKKYGLKQLFDKAIRIAINHTEQGGVHAFTVGNPTQPVLPEVYIANAPWCEIEMSTYSDQMVTALQDPQAADVVFLVEGVKEVKCHKVILCGASDFFCQVFGIEVALKDDAAEVAPRLTWPDINEGKVPGLSRITDMKDDQGNEVTRIAVSEDISFNAFSNVLQFLYTGLPNLAECVDGMILEALEQVAKIFYLPYLTQVIENIQNDKDLMNPSIGTYLNERMGHRLKCMFLGNETFSDVKFNIKGSSIPVHKVILVSRCDVMPKMFADQFVEASKDEVVIEDDDSKCFMALLEYMYTDCAPVEEGDSLGILILADKYGQERLKYLCELHIIREVDQTVRGCIATSEMDVIGLLHQAQLYNAKQLSSWCLHFITTNYSAFSERSEFNQLDGDNLEYVLKNRWPPASYLEEMKEYEDRFRKREKKCQVM
ncbi:rho-related protein racA-like [Amphiura filiformis]|uniref:rho-related protein racA-like n=1 Tax=Amphiura filiformis TaxID=82378 RepID=UPI003B2125B9